MQGTLCGYRDAYIWRDVFLLKWEAEKKIPPEHKSCVKMEFGTREALESGGPEVCLVEHWPKICT